jgi:TonB family protein
MSVEARESMSDVWTRWQGHIVDGAYPLGRYLGCSEHSGVFLTKSGERGHAVAAIKLFPANQGQEGLQLPRWKRAGGLPQPHLLPLLEWGGCQLDEAPYLYVVMEYADQTLAQLLLQRALTADEAREMLRPILDALMFLHSQDLVQGQLKPANVLVVGDQLKLASDTIRRVGEVTLSADAPTMYDPPESLNGGSSTAGDIWALGVSLFEALTRRPPSGFGEHRDTIVLPADFSPVFRDVVARCLSPRPQDRPSVMELLAWSGGRSAQYIPTATSQLATLERREPKTPEIAPSRPALSQVALVPSRPAPSTGRSPKPRAWAAAMLTVIVILALGWTGVRLLVTHRTPAVPVAPATPELPAPLSTDPTSNRGGTDGATPRSAFHEVIPDVPQRAARTIRGDVKVSVRATVDPDGSVSTAVADRTGPSRYFRRLAVEAAKKWTFPPADTTSPRLMQIQFDFSRNGTTGRAVTLH